MAALTAIPNVGGDHRLAWLLRLLALGGLGLLGVLGCGESTIVPPQLTASQLYWSLGLNQRAIILALSPQQYDTVQLTATPLSAQGTPISTTGTVTFKSLDTTIVTVSATGLVTARGIAAANSPVRVVATLQDPAQGVTHTDTAYIAVTAAPLPAIDTFSMQPVAGDSAKRALEERDLAQGFAWAVRAVDATGQTVCRAQGDCVLPVYYTSSKPLTATIHPQTGYVMDHDTGHVVFTAQTLAYGRVLRDSVDFQIGYMLWSPIGMTLTLALGVLTLGFVAPRKLILGVGAMVTFCNGPDVQSKPNAQPVDIVFDHPEAADSASCGFPDVGYLPPTGSGDIAPFGGDTTTLFADLACRRFNTPGVYRYHSTLFPSDTYEIQIKRDPQ